MLRTSAGLDGGAPLVGSHFPRLFGLVPCGWPLEGTSIFPSPPPPARLRSHPDARLEPGPGTGARPRVAGLGGLQVPAERTHGRGLGRMRQRRAHLPPACAPGRGQWRRRARSGPEWVGAGTGVTAFSEGVEKP